MLHSSRDIGVARKRLVQVLGSLLLLLVLALSGFVIWGSSPLPPSDEALNALSSDGLVAVDLDRWITFSPAEGTSTTGLVLYPGGRVDPRAYAPAARCLAERGYTVVIVPMPLNLAVFAPGRARDVIAAYPEVDVWAVGGHSLGGAMAANFISNHPDAAGGLVLWAAYPASSDDLSAREGLAALSIYATRDGLLTDEERLASERLLPATTCWVAVEGGNHAQFGAYGVQRGDNPATLSAEAQQAQIVAATTGFLEALAASSDGGQVTCP